jgi:hypothetical protein
MNIAGSSLYLDGGWNVELLRGKGRKFVIIEQTGNAFLLNYYGRDLSNEILATVLEDDLGPRCENLKPWLARDPKVLFIDDLDKTKDCARTCVIPGPWQCRVFRLWF